MIAFCKRLVQSLRYPWPPSAIAGRIRPLQFSLFTSERVGECIALFEDNVVHGVPPDHREQYLDTLGSGQVLTLMVEDGGQIVGTFGVQYGSVPNSLCLCYMMAAPEQHRQGIGTTMFLAALALLPKNHRELSLCISALPKAAGFYYRLGFRRVGEHRDSSGEMHQLAVLRVTSGMSQGCRISLEAAGATLPDASYEIPTELPA